jgi:mxaJ protein
MSSPCRSADALRAMALAAALALVAGAAAATPLRVCADPNNLPFSNRQGQGFENRLAELIGADLGMPVAYTWWPQRRGFVRNTLKAGDCDVLMGVPKGLEAVATTRPYYRSAYVFVFPEDHGPRLASLDDPALKDLRIGVQLIGDDFANAPPAHALSRRGLIANIRGYPVYGDYGEPSPAARIVTAVATGEVDAALVWGPLAGWAIREQHLPLALAVVQPLVDLPMMPMGFDMALGVRHEDKELRERLDAALARHQPAVAALLADYGVPTLPFTTTVATWSR